MILPLDVGMNKIVAIKNLDGLRVLIAEDNKINMLIARKFLTRWGIILTEAINGEEAIKLCQTNEVQFFPGIKLLLHLIEYLILFQNFASL